MMKIGVICPSEIAIRRFMPALCQSGTFRFAGVAVAGEAEWHGTMTEELRAAEMKKAQNFQEHYGGEIFPSYGALIESEAVDAVYLPLPPALHFRWGAAALKAGKHLFLEKPSATSLADAQTLVALAKEKNAALHENYMFRFHSQLDYIRDFIRQGKIGEVRLYRMAFGFPQRSAGDFRYDRALGGGALLDCGGYTLKLASLLLGESARLTACRLNYSDRFSVDLYGSATLENKDGVTAQVSFGMDNAYKCELEVWGSTGSLLASRIFTAPAGMEPEMCCKNGNQPPEKILLPADDTFQKSIAYFGDCIADPLVRKESYDAILKQAQLVEAFERK